MAAELATLTQALDMPGVDLAQVLHELGRDTKQAVNSYLGLSLSMDTGVGTHTSFFLTTMGEAVRPEVRTSLQLSLTVLLSTACGGLLTLYASRSGGLVDFAADFRWALKLDPDALVLVNHLTGRPADTGTDLSAMSAVNQAVGFLMARGFTLDGAQRELHRQTMLADTSLHGTATQLLVDAGQSRRSRPGCDNPPP